MATYKTEIILNKEQQLLYYKSIGTCRFVANLYKDKIEQEYKDTKKFVTAYTFSKYLNNIYLDIHPEMIWIKNVSSKAIKQVIINMETAYKRFFNKKGKYPKFKNRHTNNCNY